MTVHDWQAPKKDSHCKKMMQVGVKYNLCKSVIFYLSILVSK